MSTEAAAIQEAPVELSGDVNATRRAYEDLRGSGVDWFGEVPNHWQRQRIKHVLHRIIDTEHKTAPFDPDGAFLVARTSNVRNGRLVFNDAKYTDEAGYNEWTRRGVPEPGDIIFTREAPAGEACLVPDEPKVCLGQRTVLFRVNRDLIDGSFCLYSLYSGISDEFIKSLSQDVTMIVKLGPKVMAAFFRVDAWWISVGGFRLRVPVTGSSSLCSG